MSVGGGRRRSEHVCGGRSQAAQGSSRQLKPLKDAQGKITGELLTATRGRLERGVECWEYILAESRCLLGFSLAAWLDPWKKLRVSCGASGGVPVVF
jgi:hypothetical protein